MTSMCFLVSSVHVKHNNFVGCLLCHLSSSLGVWSLVSLLVSGAPLGTFRNLGVFIPLVNHSYPLHYTFIQILLCFSWLLSQNNMEKYEDDEEKRYFNFKESLWFCMTSLTPQVLYPLYLRSILETSGDCGDRSDCGDCGDSTLFREEVRLPRTCQAVLSLLLGIHCHFQRLRVSPGDCS